jgi:glycosyltransferase involved in cell wall biosynthesis
MKKIKIALFHPWIKSKGGAERVVLEIAKNKKFDVDIYTWVYDDKKTFPEFKDLNVRVLAPKMAKRISRSFLLRGLFLPLVLFSKIPLEKYDKFLISTSGMAELITFRNYKPGKTAAYVHTILRAAHEDEIKWNLQYRYKNFFSKFVYLSAVRIYRLLEKLAWRKINYAIFNSELSLQRAISHNLLGNKKFFIVHPPIEVKKFGKTKAENYFLYVSRFNENKRQGLLIDAWKKFSEQHPEFKYRLVLAGATESKKYMDKMKRKALGSNIEIKENVSEKELLELYSNCFAGIFIPYKEDFGIVPFEFLAAKKPLLAVDEGGYVKIIEKSPQFYKINEKFDEKKMIEEINFVLLNFLKQKKNIKIRQIKLKDFNEEIKKVIL